MTAALTAVLPLRVGAGKGETDLDRFEGLLWPSFRQNWRDPSRLRWLILTPAGDVEAVRQRLARMDVGDTVVDVVSEDTLLPSLVGKTGWFKQQLVKLAAATLVETPHYLTLDADVLLLRRTSLWDLLPDGAPRLGARRGSDHLDWWQASGRMLRSAVRIAPDDGVMGVTPALLETATARQVLPAVAQRNDVADPAAFLFQERKQHWSEYTLYWTLALETGAATRYVQDGRPLYAGVFTAGDQGRLEAASLRQAYESVDGPAFFVAQSTLGLDSVRLARALRRYFTSPLLRTTLDGVRERLPVRWRKSYARWRYDRQGARRHRIDPSLRLVSFTFDDFPRSALNGARQLESRGWRGTFYTSSGLLGQPWHGERLCTLEEVADIARRGHEIGNHTHTHPHCDGQSADVLAREYEQSAAVLEPWAGNRSFAFPHGAHDLHALAYFGSRFATVRTVDHGVNHGSTDLNKLRAVTIRRDQEFATLQRVVDWVGKNGGWLVFYTHDVRPEPTPYGCTEERFGALLDCVAAAGVEVATVADAARRMGAGSA